MKIDVRLTTKTFTNLIAYISIVLMFTPIIRQYYITYAFIISLAFFAFSFLDFLKCIQKNRIIQLTTLMLFVSVVYKLFGISSAGFGNYAFRFMRFISVWLVFYIMDYTDRKTQKRMFNVMLLALIINLIDNIRLWLFDSRASELAHRYAASQGMINIGRVDWQYCVGFLFLILFAYFIQKKEEKSIVQNKVLLFLALALAGVYLFFFAHSTTLILSTVFFIIMLLLFRNTHTSTQLVTRLITSVVLLVFFAIIRNYLLDLLVRLAQSLGRDKTVSRLKDLILFWDSSNDSIDGIGSLSRLKMIEIDIESWLTNGLSFCFGRGFHFNDSGDVISTALNSYSGNHSSLIDILPRYGLLGFGIFISIFHYARKRLMSQCISYQSKLYILSIWLFLLVGAIANNMIMHNVIFVAFFATSYLFRQEKNDDEE